MSRWARKVDENDYKVSEENAEKMVRELFDHYEIEITGEDTELENVLKDIADRLLKAYRRGDIENKATDSGFTIVQHLKNGDKLTYRELKGKDRISMENFDNTRAYSRAYAILGKLCGYGSDVIMNLAGRDWKTAEALALLFMMA